MSVQMNMEINITIAKKMSVGLFTLATLRLLKLLQTGIYGFIIQLIKFQIVKILNIYGKKNI